MVLSTEYLANAFRDGIILVVINLEPKQVNTKKCVAMKGCSPFVTVTKVKMKIHFILHCKAYSKIRDVFFSKIEFRLHNFKSLSHDNLVAHLMNSSDYLINCRLFLFILQ